MNIAYIMRGVPGSGKSTVAKKLAGDRGKIHSTDSFFMENGVYVFRPDFLQDYHKANLARFIASLKAGNGVVICDNTNVKRWQMTPYIRAAEEAGYVVVIVTMPHPPAHVAANRNVHGVPQATIERMMRDWEP